MSNAGVLSDLGALRGNLRRLADVPSRLARRGAHRINVLIQLNTSSGLDAYGKPFAPLAVSTLRRGRRPPPMVATGASLDQTRAFPMSGAGIAITLGGAYPHHVKRHGTRPARSVVPERAGLPATWNAALKQEEFSAIRAACPELTRGK